MTFFTSFCLKKSRVAIATALFFIAPLSVFTGCGLRPPAGPVEAVRGEMDLRSIDLDTIGSASLDGEWEFYWNRLLEPGDFAHGVIPEGMTYIRVPGTWDSEGRRPSSGYATYRLRIKVDKTDRVMGIYLRTASTSYKIWINGALIGSAGTVGTDAASAVPRYNPQAIPFNLRGETLEILCQVSNFTYRKGGLWNPLELGNITEINDRMRRRLMVDLFLLGSLLIMGLYHITLFAARSRSTVMDYSPLFFGLACISISVRLMSAGNYFITEILPALSFKWVLTLEFITMPLSAIFLYNFARSLYPEEFGRRITMLLSMFFAGVAAAIIVLPVRIFNHAALPLEASLILGALYMISAHVLALYRQRENSGLMIAGMAIILGTIVNDTLFANRIIGTGDITPFGIFGFTVVQSFILARRFSTSFVKNEELSLQLDGYAKDLESKNRSLETLDRLKDEFMASTSHELRTPITGIIGIAESLIDGPGKELSPEAIHNLSMIVSSGKRLSSLINDILDFSRIKNSELKIEVVPVDLYLAADSVLAFSRALAAGKSIALINSIDHDFPPVLADGDRLQQILFNLVGNAIKFTESGSVEVSAVNDGTTVSVSVRDSGIGIPPDRLESIFIPFEQIDSSITRNYGGTGLGLSITRQLVELQGGSIGAVSEPGKGSVFTFTVPLAGEKTDAPTAVRTAGEGKILSEIPDNVYAPLAGERPDVMVVDDEPVNVQVLANHLRNAGYTVAAARNGADCLRMLDTARPDLIILDVMMPALSGFDVCREIRKRFAPYEMPVLLLTAKNRIIDIITGFESGANDYLSKPFDKREMMARAVTLISLKRMIEENQRLLFIKKEIDVARRIQESLLPEEPPLLPGFSIHAYCLPRQSVGGDIFDFLTNENGDLGILVADVAGHGIPAALVSSMVKMAFSLQTIPNSDTAGMMESLNVALLGKCGYQFITAGYAYIDAASGRLGYSRAGHYPALVCRAGSSEVESLYPHGRLLALFPDVNIEASYSDLGPGDMLLLYTDGVVECANPKRAMFGMEGIIQFLANNRDFEPEEFVIKLIEELQNWSAGTEFEDDVTIVAVKKK